MDFLPELMNQPQLAKHTFGVQLASYLCEKYPLQRCVDLARVAINRLRRMANRNGSFKMKTSPVSEKGATTNKDAEEVVLLNSTVNEYEQALMPLLDCLVRFTKAFPFLAMDCVVVLSETRTNYKKYEPLMKAVSDTFEKLTKTTLDNKTL
jgi:hypothetical protein